LTASSPPHQPRIYGAEDDKKVEEVVEEEKENEIGNDTQNQDKKDNGGKGIEFIGSQILMFTKIII
jgi:hypothetical protein